MNEDDFWELLHQSRQQYNSIVGTDDPDLSAFKSAGGKIVQWHGLADELIFPNGSSNYYERVLERVAKAQDFYRLFEVSGVDYCFGGSGAFPWTAFDSLVKWVEGGKAPDTLDAATIPVSETETPKHRPLCLYPQVAAYKGGDPDQASSFECADTFGSKKAVAEGPSEL